ncbi:MAG TPA: tRNA (adenosine(37)-N6)-threonylcarbamoyltransferase complex transferase subunit TsaD [Fibrobacteria bacterium]|nr:tRNA (adenosine(37)-N6)-threonylcarbamoyltransferase complex transferase subunit TsaD [Fibrobacteria bacterium]
MITLGIESSCDETACGLVDQDLKVLANEVHSQVDMHAVYGGVVPEIAARAHLEKIDPVVRVALEKADLPLSAVDQVAFTRGPGLLGPLLVGASFARALARVLDRPAVGVNHLEGHLGAAFLEEPTLAAPFLCLVVSGGHTEFVRVDPGLRYTLVGKTRDDAAGEAFDKCGKILGLGYPAGPVVARKAEGGRRDFVPLPRALDQRDNFEFSFSGLKTAMLRYVQTHDRGFLEENMAHVCASMESAVVEVLVKKSMQALEAEGLEVLAVVGGVSANRHLRERMLVEARKRGFRPIFPSPRYSGDNGAMIAAIAQLKWNLGIRETEVSVLPSLRWA